MNAPRTLEEKQDETGRLWRRYRATKRAEWAELIVLEPRLIPFRKALRRSTDARALVARLSDCWIRRAPTAIRFAALQQIDHHCAKMARRNGFEPLDDPLPPRINVFLAARQLLGVR